MKKNILMLEIIAFIFAVVMMCTTVTSRADGFLPNKMKEVNSNTLLMDKYSLDKYHFDAKEEGFTHPVNSSISMILNGVSNAIFQIHVNISYGITYLIMCVYNVDIFAWIPGIINRGVEAIKTSTFDLFMPVIFVLCGIFGLWRTMMGDVTSSLRTVMGMFLVFLIATWFFRDPAGLGSDFNKASNAICGAILAGVSDTKDERPENQIANQYWTLVVMKPYEMIQYGDIDTTPLKDGELPKPEREFLSQTEDLRLAKAKDYAEKFKNIRFDYQGGGWRLGMTIFILVFTLVLHVCMLLIVATILTAQASALFWIMFGGVFFLFAMYPKFGFRAIVGWFVETFGFILKRIVITIALSGYFVLQIAIFEKIGTYGFLFVTIFSIIVLIAAIKNFNVVYEKILGLVSFEAMGNSMAVSRSSAGGIMGSKEAMKSLRKPANAIKNTAKSTANVAKGIKSTYNKADEGIYKKTNKKNAERLLMDEYEKEKLANPTSKKVQAIDERVEKGMKVFSNDQVQKKLDEMYKSKKQGDNKNRQRGTEATGKKVKDISATNKALKKNLDAKLKNKKQVSKENNLKYKITGVNGRFWL